MGHFECCTTVGHGMWGIVGNEHRGLLQRDSRIA
jgi:hypothetical protein